MEFLRRYRWPILGVGAVVVVVAFLAFRPDKLFVDDVVDESIDDAFAPATTVAPQPTTTTTPPSTTAAETGEATTTAPTTTSAPTTTAPAAPVVVTTGTFYGIDHAATGTANVYEQGGQYVLRFEDDTDIQNGPDLYVWMLATPDYEGDTPTDFLDLGKIKGNVGGQNYELPPEFDPAVHQSVMVWCLRFDVPFAAAPLA